MPLFSPKNLSWNSIFIFWSFQLPLFLFFLASFFAFSLSSYLSQFLFLFLSLSLAIYLYFFFSLSLSLAIYLYFFLCFSLSLAIYLYFFLSLSFASYLSLFLSFSLFRCQKRSVMQRADHLERSCQISPNGLGRRSELKKNIFAKLFDLARPK